MALPATLSAITILGSGRIGPTITALLGLVGAVVATRAFLAARRGGAPVLDPHRATAFVLGLAALLLGAVFLAAADSGPGTGDGVVGSAAAIVFGTLAVALDRAVTTIRARSFRMRGPGA